MSWTRRLQKELKGLQEAPPVGISLASFGDGQSITEGGWILDMVGAEGSLYSEERFQLRFTFTDTYPMEAPIVVFVGTAPAARRRGRPTSTSASGWAASGSKSAPRRGSTRR